MGVMLQFSPLFIVREARTHIPGFKPRIAPTLAAIRPHLTGRTFVPLVRLRLVNGVFKYLPTCFHGTSAEIIARDWEGGAEIHLAIGSDRKSALAAGAFDEMVRSLNRTPQSVRSPIREHLLIESDLRFWGQPIL